MPFKSYKLKSASEVATKKQYKREELERLELIALREICTAENIKTPSIDMLSNKDQLVDFIFRYRGMLSENFINKYDKERVEFLEHVLKTRATEQKNLKIEIPAQLKIYQGLDSLYDAEESYRVVTNLRLQETNALMIDDKGTIQAVLHVIPDIQKGNYRIRLPKNLLLKSLNVGVHRNLSLIFFEKEHSTQIYNLYDTRSSRGNSTHYIKVDITEVIVLEAPLTEEILTIDYGTSFTTAGTYLSHSKNGNGRIRFSTPETCEFCQDKSGEHGPCGYCELCPSVIAVKLCTDKYIEFVFGHEAYREVQKKGYMAKNSIFYDTKRWVNNYNDTIEITDFDGNTAVIKRSLIIGAFLKFVIKSAEQQNKVKYKNICFTCPVKQKSLSLTMYKEALQGYNVITKDTIDEALAIVYDSIAITIEKLDYVSYEPHSVLVIDCGGGTSDMVRCDYSISHASITSQIEMQIGYAHGDTNFGGNNLTYKIFQYLKIRLAESYSNTPVFSVGQMFEESLYDIYDFVDTKGIQSVYERFMEKYEWAENVIPTRFSNYRGATESSYLKIKGNFFFLWKVAEKIKTEFFSKAGVFQYAFGQPGNKSANSTIVYSGDFHIAVKNKKDVLEIHTTLPDINLTKDEINILLKPDIYSLIKKFIEPYYLDGTLHDITRVYLSGQTCKIELFREVLKEYIEGRKATASSEDSSAKKLRCIRGAIAYQEAKRTGRIRPTIKYISPLVPYYVTAPDFKAEADEVTLVVEGQALDDIYAYVSRYIEVEKIVFTLKNRDFVTLNEFTMEINSKAYKPTTYEHLLELYPMIYQEDIDNIVDLELKLFVFSRGESWGFNVLEVARQNDDLFCGEVRYFPFESEQWGLNFFDGFK